MKLYVASSWRSERYKRIVDLLRNFGCEVYDFKETSADKELLKAMSSEEWYKPRKPEKHKKLIRSQIAWNVFAADFTALQEADALVCLLPCGKSAHLEAGWKAGQGKPVAFLLEEHKEMEPELMYNFGDVLWAEDQLLAWVNHHWLRISPSPLYGSGKI